MPTDMQLRVAGIAGSLRARSFNRALLRAAVELAPESLSIEIVPIEEVPLYNEDLERKGDPPAVAAMKRAIDEADGLLVVTPEYNFGVPGVLKNAIDWASRPPRKSVLQNKPAMILGASPGMLGAARAQMQLRQAFVFTETIVMPQPEVLVARAGEKFDDDLRLTDEKTRAHLAKALEAFAEWIRKWIG